jgi:L-alanine-DL-glutamate epimerase-like enolase superfamily enzyme
MNIIKSITTKLYRIPLKEVLVDAKHGTHTFFELILTEVATDDGCIGSGYTYTGGLGGESIRALIENELTTFLIGKDAEAVEFLNQEMQWHIHYVGRGGIASFAISAVDIALWDIRCKKANEPLWRLAGGNDNKCNVYHGGIDLHYTKEELIHKNKQYLSEGYQALKIKVGLPNLNDDIARVEAMRGLLGRASSLMVDANYSLDINQAIKAAERFEEFDITWFEEPMDPDDLDGYKQLSENVQLPLAMGENCHIFPEFCHAFDRANITYIQPDASNCGGITGWLRVAKLAESRGLTVSSHGMQELHVSLVSAQVNSGWLEAHSFYIDRYTTRPLILDNGMAIAPDQAGIGVNFVKEKLEPHEVKI